MTLTVPGEVAAALTANRPELLKIGRPRAMDEREVAGMYQVLADLIAERFTSRREIATLRRLMAEAAETLEHIASTARLVDQSARALHISLTPKEDDAEDEWEEIKAAHEVMQRVREEDAG